MAAFMKAVTSVKKYDDSWEEIDVFDSSRQQEM